VGTPALHPEGSRTGPVKAPVARFHNLRPGGVGGRQPVAAGCGQKPIVGRREDRGARGDSGREMDCVVAVQPFARGRPDQSGGDNDDIA
jgi:hypothetical protein